VLRRCVLLHELDAPYEPASVERVDAVPGAVDADQARRRGGAESGLGFARYARGDVAHAHIGEPHRPKLRGYIRGIGARGFVHEHRAIAPGLGTRRGGSQ
jgi:hypothetical protein